MVRTNTKSMIDTFKQRITIDKLRKDEQTISLTKNISDFISYPEFLKYYADLQTITKHNLIIGANFTYSWMPTIFDFRSNEFDKVLIILNNAKQNIIPSVKELSTLKHCLNNSLVGPSKLLHFINPTHFAIWDSRVYHYLTKLEPHSYRLNNFNSYLDYLKFCQYITSLNEFSDIHKSVIGKVGYDITTFRAAELIMYSKGERTKLEK